MGHNGIRKIFRGAGGFGVIYGNGGLVFEAALASIIVYIRKDKEH